jgi:hypothetical protein
MPQPSQYNPTTGFQEEETDQVAGRSTVRTSALDAELAAIRDSINQLVTNIGLIQRDDGELKDGIVKVNSLSAAVLVLLGSAGFTIASPLGWLTATDYAARTIVTNGTGTYVCAVAHTSSVFATDLAAGKWVTIFDSVNYSAVAISFTPTGGVAATNVQSAIAEVDTEKSRKDANLGDLTDPATARTNIAVLSSAEIQNASATFCIAGGTVDAITGAFTPAVTALTNGMLLVVECGGANVSTTPTFKADGTAAKTIVRPDGSAMHATDIPSANYRAMFCYDASLDSWMMLNPGSLLNGGIPATTIDAKGDSLWGTADNTVARKSVGTDGYAIVADSGQADGVIWVPQYPESIAPNPFFQVDQLVNSATSRADDVYGHDHWYVLTQTASVQVSSQTDQENGHPSNARLTQNQATAQRMGYASIIEGKFCKHLRGQQVTFRPRVRVSSGQAIRIAVLEWSGTEDSVTSDVVNDWTSIDYADGAAKFFVDANLNPVAVGSKTPAAAIWTDTDALTVTLGSTFTNLVLFVWTENTAAQNVTLDIGKIRFVPGPHATNIRIPRFDDVLRYAERQFEKTYEYGTAIAAVATAGQWLSVAINATDLYDFGRVRFRTVKRTTPAVTTFSPATGASNVTRDVSGSVDKASAVGNISAKGYQQQSNNWVATNGVSWHWTAEIRL